MRWADVDNVEAALPYQLGISYGGVITQVIVLSAWLKINILKSTLIGIGINEDLINSWGSDVGCSVGNIPFRYLGLPVGANPVFKAVWDPVIHRLRECLAKWKSRFISRAGRIFLLKSVFNSLLLYYLSMFQVPEGVANEIEKIRRTFFWGKDPSERKLCVVDWNSIIKSKRNGVLESGIFELGIKHYFASGYGDKEMRKKHFGES
ncbi:ribonuclease H protein [Artemisia annua]|uniref:Ribonuclease H protein n=1 Tax=Artemisia annua TaxID=35608 RepID=A0A2U1Q781_ARTAN|nr:ribonuclease H protein [Artemisia annua]